MYTILGGASILRHGGGKAPIVRIVYKLMVYVLMGGMALEALYYPLDERTVVFWMAWININIFQKCIIGPLRQRREQWKHWHVLMQMLAMAGTSALVGAIERASADHADGVIVLLEDVACTCACHMDIANAAAL